VILVARVSEGYVLVLWEESKTMRIFQRYNPAKVAMYVKTLFRGRLYIKDMGAFEFDKGKILIPKVRDKRHFEVMSEVNKQVIRLQADILHI
jgi:Protein of unknown function (DUF1107)